MTMPMNCWTCKHFDTPWDEWWNSRCCECCCKTPLCGNGVLWEPRDEPKAQEADE